MHHQPPRPSSLKTWSLQLPGVGEAIRIATAEDQPIRVIVRAHIAPVLALARISFDPTELNNTPPDVNQGGQFFDIEAGAEEVFVVGERQVLFAVAAVSPLRISVAQSDAFPVSVKR